MDLRSGRDDWRRNYPTRQGSRSRQGFGGNAASSLLPYGIFRRLETTSAMLVRCTDERTEQRVRLHGLGLELRMKLAPQEPGVIPDFTDFDIRAARGFAGDAKPCSLQRFLVLAIEFEAVPVALADVTRPVRLAREAAVR